MKRITSVVLTIVLIAALVIPVMAQSVDFDLNDSGCDYYNLIEKTDYALAPGAVESEIIINDDTGSNRNVMHVIEVDLSNPNISVMPTYMGLNEDSDFSDSTIWGSQVLTEQAAHVENDLGLNVVGGINTNLRYNSDHPYGVLVWNGVVYSDERDANGVSTAKTFLSVTKEGVASLHSASEPIPEDSWQAVSANFSWIIKDGVSQYASDNHADGSRAPRTTIGIKADGTLVLMMNDGRQAPYSAGMTERELAEVLLAMGCVNAVNCDGGGSSTFISEREGTGELTMKSSPSDGGQRATLGGLLVISKAVADGKFDHATVNTEETYVTPGSKVVFTATGADSAGGPAEIPTDISWQVSESDMGTVENGVFVSSGKTGTATVQMVYNGNVVGEDSVEIVIPETIAFTQENIVVPYGKTAALDIHATVNNGLNTVKLKTADISFALSDDKLGTISGFEYTACDETSGVASGTITATLNHGSGITATANLSLGKGSSIVWDFEDSDISALSLGTGYGSKHPAHPELGRFEHGTIEVVDKQSGMVKNGDKALAVVCDFSDFYAMGYNMLKLTGLNVDMTDAVGVGFWIYLTPEATGLEIDLNNAIPFDHGTAGAGDYTEEGWYYIYAAKSDGVGANLNSISFYHTDGYDLATKINIPNIKTKFTVYIDDITVDYSTVVADREAPKFAEMSILKDADTYEAMQGQTVATDTITVMAEAKEDTSKSNYTGLDTDSVLVYVDGVQVTKGITCASNGTISVDKLHLSEGIHTVRIEIADNAGNYRGITRQIVVDSNANEANASFVPADPTLEKMALGSVYYMNIETQDIEKVQSVTTVINLDGSNNWELDYMDVADGFTATYTIDEKHNNATVTITRTGDVTAEGKAVLASLPIRIYNFDLHLRYPDCISDGKGVCNFISTPEDMWPGDGQFRIALCVSLIKGVVEFTDGTEDTFSSSEYVVDTEMDKHRNIITQAEKNAQVTWHYHVEQAVEDKDPSCTQPGYSGRTVCVGCSCGTEDALGTPCKFHEGCGSVVNWGTVIPATGHSYQVKDGKLICNCGAQIVKNGLVTVGENTYYMISGNLVNGWIVDGETYYYFDQTTYAALKGDTYKIGDYQYTFDETGVHTAGQWVESTTNPGKMMYTFGGTFVWNKFFDIDGKTYWFDGNYCMATGIQMLQLGSGGAGTTYFYVIGDDGVVEGRLEHTGLYEYNDKTYYLIDGAPQMGVVEIGEDYYHFGGGYVMSTGMTEVTANKYLTAGIYVFGEDGKLLKNGFADWNGTEMYIKDGKPYGAGAIEIDGKIYYIRSSGQKATGKYYVAADKRNGILEEGYYLFGSDGVLVDGEFAIWNGEEVYIQGGRPATKGLGAVIIDGDIYVIRSNGQKATGQYYVSADRTNDILEEGYYLFGDDGRLVDGDFGIWSGNEVYIKEGRPYAAGTVEVNGEIYYVRSGCQKAKGMYFVSSKGNGILPNNTYYYFTEDGSLADGEFGNWNGKEHYLVNGCPCGAGAVEVDGEIYYIRSSGQKATGKYYVAADKQNGILEEGYHLFDENGKWLGKV